MTHQRDSSILFTGFRAPMTKIITLLISVSIFFLAGCHKEGAKVPEPQTATISTAFVQAGEFPDTVAAVGTVESKKEAVLSAKVMGAIQEYWVTEGERVLKGKILLTIDDEDIKTRKREAQQAKAEGVAALREVEAAIKEAEAARKNADINLERFQNLYKDQAVTKKELDDMATQQEMAAARVEQADAKKNQVQAKIEQADAAITQANVMLGYTIIRSPITGVVTQKLANKGEMAVPGKPLVKVVDDTDLRLVVSAPEDAVKAINKGDTIKVAIDALHREVQGAVSEIIPAADPATRSFGVKVDLPRTPGVLPGMFGRALLPAGTRKAVLLPEGCLVDLGGVQGVYVVTQGNTLRFQAVRLGGEMAGKKEALSGLAGGERVAVGDLASLREGMKVVVK
jgi:multidrug efflux pump subunit AcrA (membrane-fusion protein)